MTLSKFQNVALGLLLVFSCHSYALDPGSDAGKGASIVVNPQCPSQEFSGFLDAFAESVEIQKAFTRFPLKRQQLDLDAEPEPKPILRSLSREHVRFPIIPNEAERKARLLGLRVDELTTRQAKLTLVKNDTDFQVSYFFTKNSCWKLERIEDWSL
jgi:hypothetical protein